MAGFAKWFAAALVGGAIGAAIWAGITYFTGYEIGWIAWGVGVAVGFAVRVSAGNEQGVGPGAMAVIGVLLALLAGKYAAVHLIVGREIGNMPEVAVSPADLQIGIADDVVAEMTEQGKTLVWPAGQSVETAEEAAHYPPEVWAEAERRWNELPPAEQQQQIAERKTLIQEFSGAIQEMATREGFADSFSPMDLLFFGLAVFSAFKIGSGMSTTS